VTFVNPYNFIPSPARPATGDLADGPPPGHHRYHTDRWHGRIGVTMTTLTPLLLAEAADDTRTFHVPTVTGPDGRTRVDLAPTQLKGMLRSAYEAVTNSRYGILARTHSTPLGYRSSTQSGSDLTPAVVIHPAGDPAAPFLRLLGRLLPPGVAEKQVLSAAVLEAWIPAGPAAVHPGPLLTGVAHGLRVEATLHLDELRPGLSRWRVHQVLPAGAGPTAEPVIPPGTDGDPVWARVRGYLHITGPTIKDKRWERLFVTELLNASDGVTLQPARDLTPAASAPLLAALRRLIDHQRDLHHHATVSTITDRTDPAGQARQPWEYYGHEPGRTAWARHLYTTADVPTAPAWTGPDQTPEGAPPTGHAYTCWAENAHSSAPTRLRPVMVSRLNYDRTPADTITTALRPATSLAKLSPADRVFGWVGTHPDPNASDTRAAYRGHVRVVRVVTPVADDAIHDLEPPVILPALSTPKPSQGRFYLARDAGSATPTPLPPGADPASYFSAGHVPRGRKVYLYRRGDRTSTTRTPSGVPFADTATTQTSTVTGWIAPGETFHFDLVVDNLSGTELGALLWLLHPDTTYGAKDNNGTWQPGRMRLGMAKPLGFGVVTVALDPARTHLARGEHLTDRFAALDPEPPNEPTWHQLPATFENQHPHPDVLRAVRNAAIGVGAKSSVHYPAQGPDDPGYEWFVANERAASKHRQVLPSLTDPAWPVSLRPVPEQTT